MSDGKFYQVLGVPRTASAEEIKSAYRELVKRHHPDLFHAASAKAQATVKLRQINEAYAVLGNPERRKRYDQAFVQKSQARPHSAAGGGPRRTAPPRREPPPRRKTFKFAFKMPVVRLRFSKTWLGSLLAALIAILAVIYYGQSVPRLLTVWVLLEQLEISSDNLTPRDAVGSGWIRVGDYLSVSDCATALKAKVKKDEREGSEAIYDEQNGTMAITLYIKKETAPGQSEAMQSITKRVRSLECRPTQRLASETRYRRVLRSLGR